MLVWRITQKRHQKTAYSGEGAERYPGRWNTLGVPMVYTSDTPSLAVLELLVHATKTQLKTQDHVLISADVPDDLVYQVKQSRLPKDWHQIPAPVAVAMLGAKLIAKYVAVSVPSAVVEQQRNVLLNPDHLDVARIVIRKPMRFHFDDRLKA